MSLTKAQLWGIGADLNIIRMLGFQHIRLLTMTKGGDPAYATWPAANFLTFAVPSSIELANLHQFLAMTAAFGLTSEVVLLMSDSKGLYYQNGVTSADYRAFIDAVWPAMWGGHLNRIYLGGDLRLGDHDSDQAIVANHRQWVLDLWPYIVAKCPTCGFGLEVAPANALMWDRGADSIAWVRANMTARLPDYIGGQLYPTSHAWLAAAGWETNGVINWAGLTQDWVDHMRLAAGPIQVFADEIGLAVGPEFSLQEQAAFLAAAVDTFNRNAMRVNVWEFADHPALGDFGLFTAARHARPAASALQQPLRASRLANLLPGIMYTPPEYDDLAWLMPNA